MCWVGVFGLCILGVCFYLFDVIVIVDILFVIVLLLFQLVLFVLFEYICEGVLLFCEDGSVVVVNVVLCVIVGQVEFDVGLSVI